MTIDRELALETVLASGDEWQSWRALRLAGEAPQDVPSHPTQDGDGGLLGPGGRASPGATGEALCHLVLLGLEDSSLATRAIAWLEGARTPARAWLDPPTEVPGDLDDPAGARVWATAAASCGLLAVGRDPGARALELLRGEANVDGRFTGGAYPTFAAAGAYWLGSGERSEMAEWALRWVRDNQEEWWGPWERATALTFWAAAGIPLENLTVEDFLEGLVAPAEPEGWHDDLGLTLRTLELMHRFEV